MDVLIIIALIAAGYQPRRYFSFGLHYLCKLLCFC